MLILVTFKKDGSRKEIPLDPGEYTMGRNPHADLRIPLNQISRTHCKLNIDGNRITLQDLNSSNGTFVNHERITQTTLSAGDEIKVGPVTFVVQIDGEPKEIECAPAKFSSLPTEIDSPDKDTEVEDVSDLDINDLSDLDLSNVDDIEDLDDAALEFLNEDGSDDDLNSGA